MNLGDKADRMFIILAGEVGIYKPRDQEEVMLEEMFYSAAMKVINDSLREHMNTNGFVFKSLIDSCLDKVQRERFACLDSIDYSRMG